MFVPITRGWVTLGTKLLNLYPMRWWWFTADVVNSREFNTIWALPVVMMAILSPRHIIIIIHYTPDSTEEEDEITRQGGIRSTWYGRHGGKLRILLELVHAIHYRRCESTILEWVVLRAQPLINELSCIRFAYTCIRVRSSQKASNVYVHKLKVQGSFRSWLKLQKR